MTTTTKGEGLTVRTIDGIARFFTNEEITAIGLLFWTIRVHRGAEGDKGLVRSAIRLLAKKYGVPLEAIEYAVGSPLSKDEMAAYQWAIDNRTASA